ncbi:hypothetical protein GS909_04680 [Rhodococcus hoagii]|nr:hypothetical protein [Prescottella equi]
MDDLAGKTLAAASTIEADVRALEGDRRLAAPGRSADRRACQGCRRGGRGLRRGGHTYSGRIAALADAAREGGLKF